MRSGSGVKWLLQHFSISSHLRETSPHHQRYVRVTEWLESAENTVHAEKNKQIDLQMTAKNKPKKTFILPQWDKRHVRLIHRCDHKNLFICSNDIQLRQWERAAKRFCLNPEALLGFWSASPWLLTPLPPALFPRVTVNTLHFHNSSSTHLSGGRHVRWRASLLYTNSFRVKSSRWVKAFMSTEVKRVSMINFSDSV